MQPATRAWAQPISRLPVFPHLILASPPLHRLFPPPHRPQCPIFSLLPGPLPRTRRSWMSTLPLAPPRPSGASPSSPSTPWLPQPPWASLPPLLRLLRPLGAPRRVAACRRCATGRCPGRWDRSSRPARAAAPAAPLPMGAGGLASLLRDLEVEVQMVARCSQTPRPRVRAVGHMRPKPRFIHGIEAGSRIQ